MQFLFHDFIHVYSPRAGADSPQGTKFWCQQKCLVTSFICCKFQKIALKSDFIHFFHDLIHVYSPGGRGRQPPGVKILMSTEMPYLFIHLLQVSKKSLWSLILFFFFFFFFFMISLYKAPGQGTYSPQGTKFWCQQKLLITSVICC